MHGMARLHSQVYILKMDIVHIITSLESGGAQGALFRLVKQTSHKVTHQVICLRGDEKYSTPLRDLGIQVHTLDMPKGKITLSGLTKLFKLLRKSDRKSTVIQTWLYHADLVGGVAARMLRHRNIIWGIRNTKIDKDARTTFLVAKLCAVLSSVVPRATISCSSTAAAYHKHLGYRGTMHIIPNGYQTNDLIISDSMRQKIRSELGIKDNFVLGFVARWDPLKDHENLLRAVNILSQKKNSIRLLLVGTGCDKNNDQLATLIHETNLIDQVLLLGERSDIAAIMNALDLHVLSSKTEAFPNVLAEAMACGTPCVTTNVGDAADIVSDIGWIVEPESPERLAAGIQKAVSILQNPTIKKAKSNQGRKWIQDNYSMEKMADTFIDVWTEVQRLTV